MGKVKSEFKIRQEAMDHIRDIIRDNPDMKTKEIITLIKLYYPLDVANVVEKEYRRLANQICAGIRDDKNRRIVYKDVRTDRDRVINLDTTTDAHGVRALTEKQTKRRDGYNCSIEKCSETINRINEKQAEGNEVAEG